MIYSWTAKTLIMMGSGGPQTEDHPHAAFVWVSKDDGDTWTDETGTLARRALVLARIDTAARMCTVARMCTQCARMHPTYSIRILVVKLC